MIESFRNAIYVMCAVILYAEFSEEMGPQEDDYDFDSFESSEDEIEDNKKT